jgi:hypothetical protein
MIILAHVGRRSDGWGYFREASEWVGGGRSVGRFGCGKIQTREEIAGRNRIATSATTGKDY